ncbi:hypothetical protein AB1A81_10835 [Bdellovibrio bacteriovorus]|uniref:Uncharacterized protein n=2 Tax=Bdellovibrio bacteriovorus TaxID=959 RepID=Q6MKM5_BDEBA|nr:hypothetical protein EP01_08065 [Bdellovibrio bacteriovorus]BEV68777.1 hypothetical protein Bb109J_c2197 [Bdellovibrio bacteriovorus]CAE80182.1 hypothetical protein predicted by Glimmer/Critica [Bdellovibrio bacteriovorus HD100]
MLRLVLVLTTCFVSFMAQASSSMDEEVPIILREPAMEMPKPLPEARGRIDSFIDNKTLRVITTASDWYIGEMVAIESQTPSVGIVGFVEITGIENKQDGTYELICELQRQSRMNFIQIGDQVMHLDLSSENNRYKGTTDLIIKKGTKETSSKYKPLFTQGIAVGETAETLWENEFLITWYGQVNYGWKEWLTVSSIIPADILGAYNATIKSRLYQSASNNFAGGLNFARIPNENRSTLNLNIYWDSISSESVISHTLLSVALFSFEDAANTTAIKSLGTSSFQTGYEFILDNWDRVLLGPSYNFESKAVGGYLSYVKIWDQFHLSFSLNSTDITSLKYAPEDGYYLLFDAYWRF